jgi:glutaminyl-tRNA synthetase
MDPSDEEGHFLDYINPESLTVIENAVAEPALADDARESSDDTGSISDGTGPYYQFMRKGYYFPDKTSQPDKLVYNQTVALRDTWAKVNK